MDFFLDDIRLPGFLFSLLKHVLKFIILAVTFGNKGLALDTINFKFNNIDFYQESFSYVFSFKLLPFKKPITAWNTAV